MNSKIRSIQKIGYFSENKKRKRGLWKVGIEEDCNLEIILLHQKKFWKFVTEIFDKSITRKFMLSWHGPMAGSDYNYQLFLLLQTQIWYLV